MDSAYRHDICYAQNRDAKTRNELCDNTMLAELKDIGNPRGREQFGKALVQQIIGTKVRFGWGLKKSQWTDALAKELQNTVIRKFKKRRVIARGVDKIWAADIVDMKARCKNVRGNNVRGKNVRGKNVRGKNIRGKNVRGKNVRGNNVRGKNIRGKNVRGKNVRGYPHDSLWECCGVLVRALAS